MNKEEHKINPNDIELNDFELRLVLDESWQHIDLFLKSIFCTCTAENKKLVDYKAYLNNLNDVVLKGNCNGCMNIAARYLETGDNLNSKAAAERIRAMKQANN